jgi:hypothetical protein
MLDFIQSCINIPGIYNSMGLPVLIEGPPGGAKTAIINQIAKGENLPLETVILSVREPQDVIGLPVLKKTGVEIEVPSWCKRLVAAGKGILFFDELACAPPSVQAAALRIVAERYVSDVKLPDGVRIIAATNSSEDAAGGWEIAPPLANRFVHYKWKGPKVDDWCDWLLGCDQKIEPMKTLTQDEWNNSFAMVKGIMTSFFRSRPNLLGPNVPADPAQASRAWESPRTWEMAARAVAWCSATKRSYMPFVEGLVGAGGAKEFAHFDFYKDLPNPRDLIMGDAKFSPGKALDKTMAVLTSLAAYAVSCPDTAPRVWEIMNDIYKKTKAKDVLVPAARVLIKSNLYNSTQAIAMLGELDSMLSGFSINWN